MALFGIAFQSVYALAPASQLYGDFPPAYAVVKVNEGGYANIPGDRGLETYAGISRRYYPEWEGWPIIDAKKYRYAGNIIPINTKFSDLNFLVERFYKNMWDAGRFGEVNNQQLANLMFDYRVHSGNLAVKAVQNILRLPADGVLGPVTLAAINKANAAQLHDSLKAQRIAFLNSLADRDPTQEQFRAGWLARLSKFPDLATPVVGIAGVLLLLGVIGVGYYLTTEKRAA